MKVLLSFVGKRDPWGEGQSEGAVLTLARYLKPDLVLLFPTARGLNTQNPEETETAAELVRQCLEQDVGMKAGSISTVPLPVADPRQHEVILRFLRRTLSGMLSTVPPEERVEFHVNLSSGTPQMHASWLVAGVSGVLAGARFYDVAPPSKATNNKGGRVREVKVSFLEEEALLDRVARALSEGQFLTAYECACRLGSVTNSFALSAAARSVAELALAYNDWDQLNFDEALPRLRRVLVATRNQKACGELAALLEEQVSVLTQLKGQPRETVIGLVDIFHNSQRCLQRGAHADSLARFYRLYEGVIFYRLRESGVEPTERTPRVQLRAAEDLLCEQDRNVNVALNEPFGNSTFRDQLWKHREVRNESIVGHGMRPVPKSVACVAVRLGKELITRLLGAEGCRRLESYPFALGRLAPVSSLLVAAHAESSTAGQ